LCTQSLTHSPSLFDAPGTEAYASEFIFWAYVTCSEAVYLINVYSISD